MRGLVFGLIVALVLTSCSSGGAPAPSGRTADGRCYSNEDCLEGFRCAEGFCEDIYHPRRKIKSY